MSGFQNILLGRSIRDSHSFHHHQRNVENVLEDSLLVHHHYTIEDLPLEANVSSTISIAMSTDGRYYASTHGDHTVKVFDYHNNHRRIRVFEGHPRTPWTVKFNPCDSNFLASGCLGFQVRVWSIRDNRCVCFIRLEAPIISLSFHPKGEYLAVASGSKLELWHWTVSAATNHISRNAFEDDLPNNRNRQSCRERSIVHTRNMRATIFHPDGNYLFIAAPDSPRQHHSSLTFCNLFAIKFSQLLLGDNWDLSTNTGNDTSSPVPPPLELSSFPTVISQIHLYSDGGIDISADGLYLLTCGRLKRAPTVASLNSRRNIKPKHTSDHSASPMSTTDRQVVNGDVDNFPGYQSQGSRRNRVGLLGQGDASNAAQSSSLSFASIFSAPQSDSASRIPATCLFDFLGTGNMVGGNIQNARIALSDREREILDRPIEMNRGMDWRQHRVESNATDGNEPPVVLSPPFFRSAPREQNSESSQDAHQSTPSTSSRATSDEGGSRKHALSHSYLSKLADESEDEGVDQRLSFAFRSIDICQHQWASLHRPPNYTQSNRIPTLNCNEMEPFPLVVDMADPLHATTTNPDSFTCLYHLKFDSTTGEILPPTLQSCKRLPSHLLQAITSARISSSCRYIMLGFGVRRDGIVVGHSEPKAVCEIVNLMSDDLESVCVVADEEDEVNIAQFHPTPGMGVVYGTKRGKVRIITRSF